MAVSEEGWTPRAWSNVIRGRCLSKSPLSTTSVLVPTALNCPLKRGKSKVQTTARYAHLARDSVKASASRIAESIGADILGKDAAVNAP